MIKLNLGGIVMLINCPECGKEISDKSKQCIYCGYPLEELISNDVGNKNACTINGIKYDLTNELQIVMNNGDLVWVVKSLREKCGLSLKNAKILCDIINDSKTIPSEYILVPEVVRNIPRCPTCGSTEIQPISGLERGASIVGLGIFSKKINKSFKCRACGYTW